MINRSAMLRNSAFNLGGALVPLLTTLVTVPIYLHHIGSARYGVVLVAWSLLGYFGFLDLGISRATNNALAKTVHLDEREVKRRIFWSSFLINGCLGLVGGLLVYFLGSFLFLHVMKLAPEVRSETLRSMPYIACMLPVALMLGVGVGTAEAHELFGKLNLIQSAGLLLGQVLPLGAVLIWGPSLTLIMPIMLGVRAATLVIVTLFAMRMVRIPLRPVPDLKLLRTLLGFGGWVTVTNIVSPIMTDIDQFVIGSLLSVSSIPFYSVPLTIIQRTLIIPTTLTRTLFPIFSRIEGKEGKALISDTLAHLSTVMTVVYVGGLFVSGPFLGLWLGADMMARGAPVFHILCVGAWANSLAFVLFSALQGQGKPRIVATIHSCEVLPYLGLMWLLVHQFGIIGSAMAWAIRVTVDAILLALAIRLDRACLIAILPGFVFTLASLVAVQFVGSSLLVAVLAGSAMAMLFLAVNFVTNPSFATLVRAFLRRRRPTIT